MGAKRGKKEGEGELDDFRIQSGDLPFWILTTFYPFFLATMARNEEKSQSMLFRFREAQAVELGVSRGKGDRRPRLASTCTTLKDCERWRGEILREISRKVSKIQDAGLTDYEIRDLNDEINKLMREKMHWERQIVTLGGANYKRTGAMLDEDGKEVPGTRGYKYFGRARELPGVKEMFAKKSQGGDEESVRGEIYKRYRNQGPAYYGDMDEVDGSVLADDRQLEEKDWQASYTRLSTILSLSPSTSPCPPFPRPAPPAPTPSTTAPSTSTSTKRDAPSESEDVDVSSTDEPSSTTANKAPKLSSSIPTGPKADQGLVNAGTSSAEAVALEALGVLKQEDLKMPTMLTKEEMEKVVLDARKKKLLEEYL
ncbi:Isy1-like splicing factor [Mrakia frigida]|uniref:Isy1p n=1 Tax=Mrakia frigida TaxID=29902 RepID=UPI003FCC2027